MHQLVNRELLNNELEVAHIHQNSVRHQQLVLVYSRGHNSAVGTWHIGAVAQYSMIDVLAKYHPPQMTATTGCESDR